jgi:predicted metal-dependent phosphoesterase TrpH
VPGIEITAVASGRDVHMLGYFLDNTHPELVTFLEQQRVDRRRRVREIADLLARLGVPVDIESATVTAGHLPGRAWEG